MVIIRKLGDLAQKCGNAFLCEEHKGVAQAFMVGCTELEEMMNKGKCYYALLQMGGNRLKLNELNGNIEIHFNILRQVVTVFIA